MQKLKFVVLTIALAIGVTASAAAQQPAAKSGKKKGCFNTEQCIKNRSSQKGLSPQQAASSCQRDASEHGHPCK